MIIFDRKTGYGQQYMLLRYTTVWSDVMKTEGMIKFYKCNPESIVDVAPGAGLEDVEVYYYPNTKIEDLTSRLKDKKAELRKIVDEAHEQLLDGKRNVFTVDLDTMKVLRDEDFNYYSAPIGTNTYIFTFATEEVKGGFPNVYCITPPDNGLYRDMFNIQVSASQTIMDCADSPTDVGKMFTYTLIRSALSNEYVSERPAPKDIRLPTNGTITPHPILKTNKLREFADKISGSLLVGKYGVFEQYMNDATKTQTAIITSKPFLPSTSATDIFGETPDSVTKDLLSMIKKDYLEKGTVRLSDMMLAGLSSSIHAVSKEGNIVPVDVDVSFVAKKMCIFEGMLYIVPLPATKDENWANIFGDDSFIMEVEEEGFPIEMKKSLEQMLKGAV